MSLHTQPFPITKMLRSPDDLSPISTPHFHPPIINPRLCRQMSIACFQAFERKKSQNESERFLQGGNLWKTVGNRLKYFEVASFEFLTSLEKYIVTMI